MITDVFSCDSYYVRFDGLFSNTAVYSITPDKFYFYSDDGS